MVEPLVTGSDDQVREVLRALDLLGGMRDGNPIVMSRIAREAAAALRQSVDKSRIDV
jgi:phosphoenolpyruvate carboxylase